MLFLREALAIARKEILFEFRFPIGFILHSITAPIGRLIPIALLYTAILGGEQGSPIPGIDKSIYIPFLIIGILFQIAWGTGMGVFVGKFMRDKHMQTVDLLFIAPIRTFAIIIGYGTSAIFHVVPLIISFLALAIIALPPSVWGFLLMLVPLVLVFFLALSIGLVHGGAKLANEDITPLFSYSATAISFVTIFMYPIEIFSELPGVLGVVVPILARINPLNAGLLFARAAWFGDALPWLYLLYLAVVTTIIATISMWVFRFTWRRFGVQG